MQLRKILIYVGAAIGALLLVALVMTFFARSRGEIGAGDPTSSSTDPFGNGSGDRPLSGGTGPFGTGTSTTPDHIVVPAESRARNIGVLERLYQPASAVVGIAAVTDRRLVVERALWVDRATGHLYVKNLTAEDALRKYTNTTIPRLQRAVVSQNGSSTIFQFLGANRESGEAFSGTLSTPPEADAASPEEQQTFMTLSGRFLQSGIENVVISPENNRIAYLSKTQAGGTALILANIDGSAPKEVATFLFGQMLLSWSAPTAIIVTSKASAGTPGISYVVNPETGTSRRILAGALGLTTLGNPDGKYVLYSTVVKNVTSLNLLNLDDLSSRRLPPETLPEKCVWSRLHPSILYCAVPSVKPAPGYPDIWYRGEYHSTDLIWRIDVATESTDIVAPPPQGPSVTFDGVNLTLGPQELHLLFINQMDDTLYSVELPDVPVNL